MRASKPRNSTDITDGRLHELAGTTLSWGTPREALAEDDSTTGLSLRSSPRTQTSMVTHFGGAQLRMATAGIPRQILGD